MKRERTATTTFSPAPRPTLPAIAVIIAVGLMSFAGCDLFIDDGDTARSARFEARLDAEPINIDFVEEANVRISRVELVGPDAGRVAISNKDRTIDLLDLTDGASALLGEEHIRPGRYNEIRLYVEDVDIVFEDGTSFDLDVPDRRFRIGLDDFVVRGNDNVVLTLTLDAEDSFEVHGDPDSPEGITGFTFDPVIFATDIDWRDRDHDDDKWDDDDRHHDDDDDDDDD